MTSKLTILSIDPEAAGRDVRHLQETVLLLEQLRQLLENIGSRDLADRAAHAAGALQEAVRCIRESARKYENVELEPELTRPGRVPAPSGWLRRRQSCWPRCPPMRNGPAGSGPPSTGTLPTADAWSVG